MTNVRQRRNIFHACDSLRRTLEDTRAYTRYSPNKFLLLLIIALQTYRGTAHTSVDVQTYIYIHGYTAIRLYSETLSPYALNIGSSAGVSNKMARFIRTFFLSCQIYCVYADDKYMPIHFFLYATYLLFILKKKYDRNMVCCLLDRKEKTFSSQFMNSQCFFIPNLNNGKSNETRRFLEMNAGQVLTIPFYRCGIEFL